MDQQIVEFISNFLGLSYDSTESSIVVLVVIILFRVVWELIKLLRSADRQDAQQMHIQDKLIELLASTISSQQKTASAIEANSEVLRTNSDQSQKVADILTTVGGSLDVFTEELRGVKSGINVLTQTTEQNQPILDTIRNNLLKTSKTSIVVEDSENNTIATLDVEPNENGELVIRVDKIAKDE